MCFQFDSKRHPASRKVSLLGQMQFRLVTTFCTYPEPTPLIPLFYCHLPESPGALRRLLPYRSGIFILTYFWSINPPLQHEVRHKLTELQQIAKAAKCASASRRGCRIGPLRRNGANSAVGKAKQPTLSSSVAALCNAYPALPGIRMKGVGHCNKVRRGRRNTCISD